MPDSDAVIRTENLSKTYDTGVLAVDGLNLSVHAGEIFGLLGPNGAGKTTTVGMLTTRVIPTGGSAWIAGIDVVAHPTVAKRVMGVVSQTNTLDRSLTVWENLFHHGKYFGMPTHDARNRADQLLERFRLADRASADVNTLSGGMAQRLMVARSIVHHPSILFLDEPTVGMDNKEKFSMLEIIKRALKDRTVMVVDHDLRWLMPFCNYFIVLDNGKIAEQGTGDELLGRRGLFYELYHAEEAKPDSSAQAGPAGPGPQMAAGAGRPPPGMAGGPA